MACPTCGSAAVFYSCTPDCCFNHVCGDCGTAFEPVTTAKGGTRRGVAPPDPLPDATSPTVACIRCDSTSVYQAEDGVLVCTSCGTLLELQYTAIAPG
jgi:hypothetical protein